MTAQPDYIAVGGELKDFQITGLNWLAYLWCRHENGILADEVSIQWSWWYLLTLTLTYVFFVDGPRQE